MEKLHDIVFLSHKFGIRRAIIHKDLLVFFCLLVMGLLVLAILATFIRQEAKA